MIIFLPGGDALIVTDADPDDDEAPGVPGVPDDKDS
jgi:hypothetical protein